MNHIGPRFMYVNTPSIIILGIIIISIIILPFMITNELFIVNINYVNIVSEGRITFKKRLSINRDESIQG